MEEYTVVLESQLGPRQGCLRFTEANNGIITGTLTLLGYENAVHGARTDAHTLHLCHHLRTRLSDLRCVSELEIKQGALSGMLRSGHAAMPWHGEKRSNGKAGNNNDA